MSPLPSLADGTAPADIEAIPQGNDAARAPESAPHSTTTETAPSGSAVAREAAIDVVDGSARAGPAGLHVAQPQGGPATWAQALAPWAGVPGMDIDATLERWAAASGAPAPLHRWSLNREGRGFWVGIVHDSLEGAGVGGERADLAEATVLVLTQPAPAEPFQAKTYRWLGAAPATILDFRDLDRDGQPELVVAGQRCGASTCTVHVSIHTVLPDGAMRSRIAAAATEGAANTAGSRLTETEIASLSLGDRNVPVAAMSSGSAELADLDGDGISELVLEGGLLGSAGAGLQRARTEVWSLVEQEWTRTRVLYDPDASAHPWFRVLDGDAAWRSGAPSAAATLYQRAIDTPWPVTGIDLPWSASGQAVRALARLRAMQLAVHGGPRVGIGSRADSGAARGPGSVGGSGDSDADAEEGTTESAPDDRDVARWLDAVASQSVAEDGEFASWPVAFATTWGAVADMATACAVVAEEATQREHLLIALQQFGYANPDANAQLLCPGPFQGALLGDVLPSP